MLFSLLVGAVLSAQDGVGKNPPAKLELFGREDWYRGQEGVEREFAGVLTRLDRGKGVVGFGRFNPYRLTLAVPEKDGLKVREVYIGGKPNILDPYVNRRVTLVGKAVDMEVEGQVHREIWPALLVLAQDGAKDEPKDGLKIAAKSHWPYGSANPNKREAPIQKVIRSAEELVAATPFKDRDAPQQVLEKMATEELTRLMRIDRIDWDKQMLVVVTAGTRPTGGWRVEIDRIAPADGDLKVAYSIIAPKGFVTQAFTHPGTVVLTEKFAGKVIFDAKVAAPIRPPFDRDPPVKDQPKDEPKDEAKTELKVFGRTPARLLPTMTVIRSAEELAKAHPSKNAETASAALAKALKVDAIDWTKQMLVSIHGGTQRSGGYSVELTGLEVKDKALTVRWKLNTPRPGQPVTLALTNPALTLLVERFEGEVRFDPKAAKGGLDR